jgi:hypothetical protein
LAEPEIVVKSRVGVIAAGELVPLDLGSPVESDPSSTWVGFRLVSMNGDEVPMFIERRDSSTGQTRLWITSPAPESDSTVHLRIRSRTASAARISPFVSTGLRTASMYLPDSVGNPPVIGALLDLARPTVPLTGIHALARLDPDPVFAGAWSLSASYGPDLVELDPSIFGGDTAVAFFLRFHLLDASIGRLWLLELSDSSTTDFVRAGWGGDSLVLETRATHVALHVPADARSHVFSLVRGIDSWKASLDGAVAVESPLASNHQSAKWTRRVVGRGGGIAIKEMFAVAGSAAESQSSVLADKVSIDRIWPDR